MEAHSKQKHRQKLLCLCKKGKFKAVLDCVHTTEELQQGYGPDLSQPLHYFAGCGNIQAVKDLIERYGCNPQCQNVHGITPLHCACYCGKINVVKYLVTQQKCDINLRDKKGVCPLGYTAYYILKEDTVLSPLNFLCEKLRTEYAQVAKFLLAKNVCVTSSELCVLRLPLYSDSNFAVFRSMVDSLKSKLQRNREELYFEISKCLEIAVAENKWGFAKNLLRTYSNVIKRTLISDSVQASLIAPDCLHVACDKGNLEFVKTFLQLNICQPDVKSAKIAIEGKHYELLSLLLKSAHRAILMDRCERWSSLLSYVFQCHHQHDRKLTKIIVAASVSTNIVDADGNSPLHLACKHSESVSTQIMEEYKCYQNIPNHNRELPLHIACKTLQLELIKLVSSHLKTNVNTLDVDGNTPLHIVCHSFSSSYQVDNLFDCCKYLIMEKKLDGDLNVQNNQGELPFHILLRNPRSYFDTYTRKWEELTTMLCNNSSFKVNSQDKSGNTPLHIACMKKNDVKPVLYLTSNFICDLDLINDEGYLPLHYALRSKMPFQAIKAVSHGCTQKYHKNKKGQTPLHIACERYSQEDNLTSLLDVVSSADSINVQDTKGNSPLHYACRCSNSVAILFLISKSHCDVNLLNHSLCLPLHYAIECRQPLDVIEAISAKCTKKDVQNNLGKTPLHLACEIQSVSLYGTNTDNRKLLEVVSDAKSINAQDSYGNTALHIACKRDDEKSLLYIISDLNCSVNIQNHQLCLPLHIALMSHMSLEVIKEICFRCTQKHKKNELGKTPLHIACENATFYHNKKWKEVLELVFDARSLNIQDVDGNTALHIACKKDDEKSVLYIISELNCSVNIQNHQLCLPLHIALMSHMPLEVIKEICVRCTQKHKKNEFGKTPLHIACENATFYHDKKLKEVLELVFDARSLNVQDVDGNTPLHIACKMDDADAAFFLVSEKFCDVNLLNCDQCLPLHYAVKSCKAIELVKIVSTGCTQIHMQDKNGMTALHYVCKNNNVQVAKYLLFESDSFPSDVHQSAVYNDLIIHFACENEAEFTLLKALANEKNANVIIKQHFYHYHNSSMRDSPIHVALTHQNLSAIEFLSTTLCCDLSYKDSLGRLPLHIACSKSLKCVERIIPRMIIDDINIHDNNGDTPLHVAVKQTFFDIVKFLLRNYKCDVNISNKKGELPLHTACTINSLEMIKILIEEGGSGQCTYQTNDGNSPLHIACRNGAIEIVEYLVESCDCRPSMTLRNDQGRLPIDYACKNSLKMVEMVGQSCSVEDLVSREYKISDYYHNGYQDKPTTLDIACCSGLLDVVMYLIKKRGCSLSALANNQSALACACGMNYDKNKPWPDIVGFLIGKCGYDPRLSFNSASLCKHACKLENVQLLKALTSLMVDIVDSNGNTPLHYASLCSCVEIAQFLIDSECDQTIFNNEGELAIHIACRTSLEITKLLTDCDIHSLNANGNAPLHIACSYKMEDIVKYLTDELKCDVNMPNGNGECALHLACERSLQIEILVQKGDIDSQNGYRKTPLHIACSKCDYDMILFLLNHGCSADIPDTDGNLALHTLIKHRNSRSEDYNRYYSANYDYNGYYVEDILVSVDIPQTLDLLLERNMTAVLSPNHNDLTPIDMAVVSGDIEFLRTVFIKIEIGTSTKNWLLHIACSRGMSKSISFLVANGASPEIFNEEEDLPQHVCLKNYDLEALKALGPIDISKEDRDKNNILHLACRNRSEDILKYILQSFDNSTISKCFSIQNMENDTPLHLLATNNNYYSPELLNLIKYDNPNLRNNDGNTPLHLACKFGFSDLAKHLLINCQCNPNIINDEGELPLHIAAAKSQELVKILANQDNVNQICTRSGNTPLHIACSENDNQEIVEMLLDFNCDHTIINKEGNTALHIAAASSLEIVKLIVTSDCVNLKNKEGDTPLHIASRYGCWDTIIYLIEEHNCLIDVLNDNSDSAFHIMLHSNDSYILEPNILSILSLVPTSIVDIKNNFGDTLLHIACRMANEQTVLFLIKSLGCKLDVVNKFTGITPLYLACYRDFTEVVKFLDSHSTSKVTLQAVVSDELEYAWPSYVSGDTALHVVCRNGNYDILTVLLRVGHKDALNYHNEHKDLPFHIACRQRKKITIDLLSSHYKNFDCNAVNELGDTALHIVCRNNPNRRLVTLLVKNMKCRIDIANKEGNFPLHIFCQGKNLCISIIRLLSSALSDDQLRLRNNNGHTALHELLRCPHRKQKLEQFNSIFQIFIKRGLLSGENCEESLCLACRYQTCDIIKLLCDTYFSFSLKISRSALHKACLNTNKGVLKYVLQIFDHDVNSPTLDGDLPLHLAIRTRVCTESTILLIKSTKDINFANHAGNTPLHELYNNPEYTLTNNHFRHHRNKSIFDVQVLRALLDVVDISLSAKNSRGETPLHYMCRRKRYDDVKLVLEHKSTDVNVQDQENVAILHIACEANNYEAVKLLISLNANPSVKDNNGQTPITIATDHDIIKLLIKHGADPTPLYTMRKNFFEVFSSEKPPPTPVNLMVIGHPSVGKTTLIQSLQCEVLDTTTSTKFDHTAGVVPTNFNSQVYGEVTFYDFAGQPEYYPSHDKLIHNTIKSIPPIVIIVINLTESDEILYDQLLYWINFIANRCAHLSDSAHLIVIGSHADILEKSSSEKIARLCESVMHIEGKKVCLKGFTDLNCTKSLSEKMTTLRIMLQESTSQLRETGVMHFNSHCFYVFLLHSFKASDFVTLGRVTSTLKLEAKYSENSPLLVLSTDRDAVIKLCQDLSERGHLMFIEHPSVMDMSWLILNQVPLLNNIVGSIFAPIHFPQHCPLSYSTGVIPYTLFEKYLCAKSNYMYPASLLLTFLSRMEYCREVVDKQILQSIVDEENLTKSERYFFFPSLVSLERPNDKWSNGHAFSYKCGWLIQCTDENEFFSPCMIQTLLLRLTFSFTTKKIEYDTSDLVIHKRNKQSVECSTVNPLVIKRVCSVWYNGIYWQEESGVKTIVDVINQRTLVLLMQCFDGCEFELVKGRSQIISMILSAKQEFCSEAKVLEYFIHPSCVTHPLANLESIQNWLFSFPRVKSTIERKQPCVINECDNSIKLEDLLYFEPYSQLSMDENKSKKMRTYKERIEQLSIFRGRQLPKGK